MIEMSKNIENTNSPSDQLESRYLTDKEGYFSDEQRKRTKKKSRGMAEKTIQNLQEQKNRPKALEYFDGVLAYEGGRIAELREFHERGGKNIGTLCVMVPLEIINALGAKAIRVCSGYYECVHPANELLGDAGLCPLVKSTLGAKMVSANPLFDILDLVVAPATCDGKMKLAEIMEDWIPVVMLNVPRVKTGDTTSKLWLEEIKFLVRRLENLTGQRLKRKSLLAEIKKWNAANSAWNTFMEFRTAKKPLISGRDAMMVAQASQMDDIERWIVKVTELNSELKNMTNQGIQAGEKGAARLMLAGSPMLFPNFKIPTVIEESGGIIVYDELCSANRILNDPVIIDETNKSEVIRALAERYFFPCTCPCFSPNDERILRLKEAIRLYNIEGVVFHSLRGCHLNNLEATKIELTLGEMEMPMLKLESEYDEGDIEQIRTRVEAFVEMIKARRKLARKKRKQKQMEGA
jgi:benzoyl-CoA reductase/2-hydroxyglutaryl-CoA dehydratase subunit BcrC/BadD/HgdB